VIGLTDHFTFGRNIHQSFVDAPMWRRTEIRPNGVTRRRPLQRN
jgi:hypothetical protein